MDNLNFVEELDSYLEIRVIFDNIERVNFIQFNSAYKGILLLLVLLE